MNMARVSSRIASVRDELEAFDGVTSKVPTADKAEIQIGRILALAFGGDLQSTVNWV